MRIWNFLIIYSCCSDAGKKALNDENDKIFDGAQNLKQERATQLGKQVGISLA